MSVDTDGLLQLYLEMRGEAEKQDLSDVWEVQLGIETERLHLNWYEKKRKTKVKLRGRVMVHPRHDDFSCTLDGWAEDVDCPIEVKHCNGFESLEAITLRYKAQCHMQMMCCNADRYVFSVIQGAAAPSWKLHQMDHAYGAELMTRAFRFMDCVKSGTPPVPLPPPPPPPEEWRDYRMEDEAWRTYAQVWLQSRGAADSCATAAARLKTMVPEDAKRAWGAGIIITRNRGGALSLRSDV
jgi:hypothetical protein